MNPLDTIRRLARRALRRPEPRQSAAARAERAARQAARKYWKREVAEEKTRRGKFDRTR